MLKGLAIVTLLAAATGSMHGQPNAAPDAQPKWYAALERPDWWLVIIAALTGAAIAWQSMETRRAVKGTQEAARATLLNAQYLVNSERPWLLAYATGAESENASEDGKPPRLEWEVKNVGKTPARLVESAARFVFNLDEEPLPDGEAESHNGRILVPGGTLKFKSHWYTMKDGKYRRLFDAPPITALDLLCGFGFVKYRDTFDQESEYISSFCDSCFIGPGYVSGDFSPSLLDEDPAYTKCT
jgi:hypothetical protein